MAECLFNAYCEARALPWRAQSAGLYAADGAPASDGAFAAMKERGLSLGRHCAQPVTLRLLRESALTLCMSEAHAEALRRRFPQAETPIDALRPAIPDPFGGSLAVYRQTADELARRIPDIVRRLQGASGQL